jgi:putative membrane protein
MTPVINFALIIVFCILGVFIGTITGLLPGLHVNNVSLILLSFTSSIIAICNELIPYGVTQQFIFILIAGFILSIAIAHSFVNAIPATFIGAPDEDTALSVLPAHGLLLEGEGYKAVVLSAFSSYGAILCCLILIFPIRFLIGPPFSFYSLIQEAMVWVLIAIVILMIATEKAQISGVMQQCSFSSLLGILFACFVFFLSGIFGIIILTVPISSPIGLPTSILFPAFAGLFGAPTLLQSLRNKSIIPEQKTQPLLLNAIEKKLSFLSIIIGSLAGVIVSIIPGVTTAIGTVLAMNLRQKTSKEQTIVALSSVNTAAAFCMTLMLFIIGKARSGVMITVSNFIAVEHWDSFLMPVSLTYLLMFLVLGGSLSYFFTLLFGKLFAKKFHILPYHSLVVLTLIFLAILVVLFTGILGLFVLFTATCIGFLPLSWGVRRSHCMGVLLVPIILYFL